MLFEHGSFVLGGDFLLTSGDQIIISTCGHKRYSHCPTTLRLADQADENHIWYHSVWRKHENMIPCTGIRVNANYERIASWGGWQCWTWDTRISETRTPRCPSVVASVWITQPWYLIPDRKECTFSNHDLIVINQLPDNQFDFSNVAYPIHLRNWNKSNQDSIVASLR